jgi:hypothetical protein
LHFFFCIFLSRQFRPREDNSRAHLVVVVGRLHRRELVLVVGDDDARGARALRVPDLFGKLAGGGGAGGAGRAAVDEEDWRDAGRGAGEAAEVERGRCGAEVGAGEAALGRAGGGDAGRGVGVDKAALERASVERLAEVGERDVEASREAGLGLGREGDLRARGRGERVSGAQSSDLRRVPLDGANARHGP